MNRTRRLRRHLAGLPRPAAALAAVAPARSRWTDPPFPLGWKLPPGWDNYLLPPPGWTRHPPLPLGHLSGPVYQVPAPIPAHTTVASGMPGWQITLITATAVLLAAALALAVYRTRSRQEGPRPAAMIQLPKQPGHASAAAV